MTAILASTQLVKQAATPVAGTALVNSTPTIITWTAPNDGVLHRAVIFYTLHVTSNETGGQIVSNFTSPDGGVGQSAAFAGGQGAGVFIPNGPQMFVVEANTAVSVAQGSALSGGAAVLFAEIWAS